MKKIQPLTRDCFIVHLRGYWSLELVFLDENLANQGVEDIIQISQFEDLAFSLRERCVKTFLYAHTLDTLATFLAVFSNFDPKLKI
jgi:hypothetical protein